MHHVANEFPLRTQCVVGGTDMDDLTVWHDDLQLTDMICGCAVDRHMRATGIIRNHASQRRTRARGHVRPKTITVRLEKIIELVEDDPGSYTDGPALKVEIGYLPNITRAIDDQAVANGSANQAGAGSTRDDRYARL